LQQHFQGASSVMCLMCRCSKFCGE